jgi:hypothetical protein
MTGLEALNKIDEVLCDIEIKYKENLGYTKPLTKTIEKSLKALEIIKKKRVNVGTFIHLTKTLKRNYEECQVNNLYFGFNICEVGKDFLTQEEFDLLKEILK